MDPASSSRQRPTAGLPRARGDGPGPRDAACWRASAPPRSRGWTSTHVVGFRGFVGSPALAGMDPARASGAEAGQRLPRARGDGPVSLTPTRASSTAPPRSRGWTRHLLHGHRRLSGSPALAGMDPSHCGGGHAADWLPRARGDGPTAFFGTGMDKWAPPRSRGWTRGRGGARRGLGGSPALAGMDPMLLTSGWSTFRLPRARGDGPARSW